MAKGTLGFRRVFLTGLPVTLPALVTAYVLLEMFYYVDGILQPIFTRLFHFHIPGLGFFALLVLVLLMGLFASHFLGARIVGAITARLERVPLLVRVDLSIEQALKLIISGGAAFDPHPRSPVTTATGAANG